MRAPPVDGSLRKNPRGYYSVKYRLSRGTSKFFAALQKRLQIFAALHIYMYSKPRGGRGAG